MIDWHTIDTVLLDMDGTLLDLHFDNYFWLQHLPLRYSEARNVSIDEAKTYIHQQVKSLEGTLEWYCLDHWSELVDMDIPALKHELKHKIQIRPYAELFLKQLRKLNKNVVLITNSHRKGLSLKLDVTSIDKWLDIIISSHDYKSPKEEPLFWQQLQQSHPFDCARTVFIDDTPRVLRSAHRYGIAHLVCITSPDSQKQPHDPQEFLGIEHFDQIMPLPFSTDELEDK